MVRWADDPRGQQLSERLIGGRVVAMTGKIWRIKRGVGPLVATAIHDGHDVRPEIERLMAISDSGRLREEDPFTADWTRIAQTQVVGTRSRFEIDLNRPRNTSVYRNPEDAWGLEVWKDGIPEAEVSRSLREYDDFYGALKRLYSEKSDCHGRFVVFELHNYNHRRDGAGGPVADPALNPQVNIGTGTLADRDRWAPLIDRFISDLAGFAFPGGRLDVRENIKFRGGACGGWAHATFPDSVCVLSIEVKKFFMDEWTGTLDPTLHTAVGEALAATVPGVLEELERL
jgi:N-formylglutamate deformylase